ncbi:MAG: hypothetical protein LUD02_02560 [Tannerellaceae bacterium]|nr:hypothetical protein [Tannerellaceae bacterium]MCD8263157.1 hypothetical protein [Tannerellaceae bacterium]
MLGEGGLNIVHENVPYIDFYNGTNLSSYTSRLAEYRKGELNTSGKLVVGSTSPTINKYNRMLYVNGVIEGTGQLYAGDSIFTGGKTSYNSGVGCYLGADGTIHMNHLAGANISFHYADNIGETSKIQEIASGKLNITASNGLLLNNRHLPLNLAGRHLSLEGSKTAITTEQFIQILEDIGAFSSNCSTIKGNWSYANNDYITDTGCGTIHLAGAVVEVFNQFARETKEYTIQITTPNTSGTGDSIYPGKVMAQFIYNNQGSNYKPGWWRVANATETPQFGTYTTLNAIVSPTTPINLEKIYDLRYTYTGAALSGTLALAGGIDGMEYVISVNNTGTGNLTIHMPTGENYQSNSNTLVVQSKKVGQIFVNMIIRIMSYYKFWI